MLREMLTENLPQKAIALAIAVTLVAMKREEETDTSTATVRVQVTEPDGRVLVSPTLEEVIVGLEGKAGRLREIDIDALPDLHIRLTGLEGGQIAFERERFTGIPRDIRITSVRPPVMLVQLEEKVKIEVPVEPVFEGEPGRGYRVTQFSVDPPKVTVEGAKSAVERLQKVKTRVVSLRDAVQTTSLLTELQPAPRFTGFLGRHSVRVTVQVEEKTGTRVIASRRVEVRGVAEGHPGFEVSPETVDLTLHGPVRLLDAMRVEELVAYVDVSAVSPKRRSRLQKVSFDPPAGLKSSEIKPEKVTLVRKEAPPAPPDPAPPTPP